MPLKDLPILPGLFTIQTDRMAKGRWKNGDHVRFWKGLPEKIGGWQRAVASSLFVGKARGVVDWQSLDFEKLIGLGTHLKLYAWSGGVFYDITPIRTSGTLGADPFDTTDTSAVVNVSHTGHGLLEGDYVHFSGAAAVGGITIDGEYTVTEVVDTDNYTITHSAAATSTATGGGAAVDYEYEIHVGAEDSLYGLGWGAGPWGGSTWGTPRLLSNFLTHARTWSLDTWGEDLIANPKNGGIYVWDTSVGGSTRATAISGAPSTATAILVSPEARHLVALGAHDGSADDPLLIRWSSSEDYTDFTESVNNTAGSHRLDVGNEILCGVKTDREIVIHTDTSMASMVYQGNPYQFEIRNRGSNGGIMGPNAAKEFDGRVFWMAQGDFYVYDGQIRTLGCEVHNHVFDDINLVQRAKVFAGANRRFGEVWWLYCSEEAEEVDRYVVYNVAENHWTFGTLERTLFVGDSDNFVAPYAAGTDGYLYDHEIGVDDDVDALAASLESGDLEVGEGEYLAMVKKFIPDFERIAGTVSFTISGKKYPQGSATSNGPHSLTSSTEFVRPRIRARQLSLSFSTADLGADFRLGVPRVELVPYGKR